MSVAARAFADPPDDDFVVLCYRLTSRSQEPIERLRVGILLGWDFNDVYSTNSVGYEADIGLGVVSDPSTANMGGVTVLNPEAVRTFRAIAGTDS